jgi:hypothetical protein
MASSLQLLVLRRLPLRDLDDLGWARSRPHGVSKFRGAGEQPESLSASAMDNSIAAHLFERLSSFDKQFGARLELRRVFAHCSRT